MNSFQTRPLSGSLMALSIAAALTGPQVTIASKGQAENVLTNMTDAAASLGARFDGTSRRIQELQSEVDRNAALFAQVAEIEWCADAPVAYLQGNEQGIFPSVFEVKITTPRGRWYFDFPAGATLQDVVDGINNPSIHIGVIASISSANGNRVEIRGPMAQLVPFLRVQQTTELRPSVFSHAVGGAGMLEWLDYGCVVGVPICAEPAVLYLSTGTNLLTDGKGHTTLLVRGAENHNSQSFTFASGTSQLSIISALNTFQDQLGVRAAQVAVNPSRIEVRSFAVGDLSRVQLLEVGGVPPIIFDQPKGGSASYDRTDAGQNPVRGDVNCDRFVAAADLREVIDAWGACPPTPSSCPADLDHNDVVNVDDLLTVINHWGDDDEI